MKSIILAWRNLWRNTTRSMIIIGLVMMSVLLSTSMASLQDGQYQGMIDNFVKFSGHLQIHDSAYWEDKTIENTFIPDDALLKVLENNSHITEIVPRVEYGALATDGLKSKPCGVIGIVPEKENRLSEINRWIHEGDSLSANDDGLLITSTTAKNLDVKVGDTIILMGQGFHASTASGLFPVRGILKFPSPTANNMGVFLELKNAQQFFNIPNRLTSINLLLDNYKFEDEILADVQSKIDPNYKLMSWEEMSPEIVKGIESDKVSGAVFKFIIYMLVGFVILGTVIMLVNERKKEIAVLMAIGMHKKQMAYSLFIETIILGMVGVAMGFIISVPLVFLMVANPIPLPAEAAEIYAQFGMEPVIYFGKAPWVFVNQALTVFILCILISLYPIIKAFKFNVIKALRH